LYQIANAYLGTHYESTIAEAALTVRTSVIEDVIRFAAVVVDFTPASKATPPNSREVKPQHEASIGERHETIEVLALHGNYVEVFPGTFSVQLGDLDDIFNVALRVKPTICSPFWHVVEIKAMYQLLTQFNRGGAIRDAGEASSED
jgi:hypothetical protein